MTELSLAKSFGTADLNVYQAAVENRTISMPDFRGWLQSNENEKI